MPRKDIERKGRRGNQYTAYKEFRLRHGPDVPYPYEMKRIPKWKLQEMQEQGIPIPEGYFEIQQVMGLPKRKKRAQLKRPRSDKGKSHKKKSMMPILAIEPDKIEMDWFQLQKDLKRTLEEIEEDEIQLQLKANRERPERVQLVKDQKQKRQNELRRRQRERLGTTREVIRRRENKQKALPENCICPLCDKQKTLVKQWVRLEFADGIHYICRVCYEQIRLQYFDCNTENCRAWFKCARFEMIGEKNNAKENT